MDAAHRNMLIDALEKVSAEAGHDLYEGAIWLKAWLDERYLFLEVSQSRERLDAFFASSKDDDEARIVEFVTLLSALPRLAGQFIDQAIVETAEKMAPAPPGRREIEPEIKRKIIETVGRLHMQGVSIGAAQFRAAQQLGLGKRSVERVWQQRKALAEQPFQTMSDVWDFLSPP